MSKDMPKVYPAVHPDLAHLEPPPTKTIDLGEVFDRSIYEEEATSMGILPHNAALLGLIITDITTLTRVMALENNALACTVTLY